MSIYQNPVLVTLTDSSSYILLQTCDEQHGRAQRFYLTKTALRTLDTDNSSSSIIESDLLNFCCLSRYGNSIRFRLFWLQENAAGKLTGYQQQGTLPAAKIRAALNGFQVRHLCFTTNEKATLTFTPTAFEAIAETVHDPLKRRALCRFFRDNLNYGAQECLIVQRDSWTGGFYFCSSVTGFDGGIVPHETQVSGKDGKSHRKLVYSIHT